ncbi:ATP-binding cassette domain-containing protein, partial [Staphylococcus aureus]
MIMIDKLVAGYSAEVDILKGMSLHAEHAEIITLLGPNGCGKSTLLKTIAGFLKPRQGSVTLQGVDISA